MLFVYDMTTRQSLLNLLNWYKEAMALTPAKTKFFVCENKIDLDQNRVISCAEGQEFSASVGGRFFKVSAKEGVLDMDVMFREIAKDIVLEKGVVLPDED